MAPAQVQQPRAAAEPNAQGKPPLEFNHAIQYVNKIKNRFSENQKIYKDFLEILHTYQKEQKSIHEVYQEVEQLFHNQADLLEEFAQFLPEAGAEHLASKQQKAQDAQRNAYKRSMEQKKMNKKKDMVLPPVAALEDLAFFEKVKRALKSKHVFENFLRCLNLYSHEIIDREELVKLVEGFLGKFEDLMLWFKTFVGYRDRSVRDERKVVAQEQQPELDLRTCKQLDKSYRALPTAHVDRKCTGRDDLEKDIRGVLNDKWVSFPTWSEDSASFLATKKNSHEEAIFRCEDERFELDIVLEANLSTIGKLDTAWKMIDQMSPDKRARYKFDTRALGGDSEIIHYKAVQRLYGDRTEEVLMALERDPHSNIPLVIKRLRQKNNEWRSTQRQWNHVWRELNEKHYLRSLDYRVQNYKRTDPIMFRPKALREAMVSQRDEFRAWKKSQAAAGETIDGGDGPPPPIVKANFSDVDVLGDVTRLVLHATKKLQLSGDINHMTTVLTAFLPEMLFLESSHDSAESAINDFVSGAKLTKSSSDDADPEDEDNDGDNAEDATSSREGTASADRMDSDETEEGGAPGAAVEVEDDDADATADPNGTSPGDSKVDNSADGASESNGLEAKMMPKVSAEALTAQADALGRTKLTESHQFVTNRHWFVFFRLFQILYERLLEIKKLSAKQVEVHAAGADSDGNVAVSISLALKAPLDIAVDGYYDAFLKMSEKFVDQSIEATSFEETCREMFNIHAYKVFTIDKLITHLAKKLSQTVGDETSRAVAGLYVRSQTDGESAVQYREKAFKLLTDQNVFVIEQKKPRQVVMELLDFELDSDEPGSTTKQWREYVTRYKKLESTDEKLDSALQKHPVYMKRNKMFEGDADKALEDVDLENKLECKVCVQTYKLFFVVNGSDLLHRRKQNQKDQRLDARKIPSRTARFQRFLGKWVDSHVSSTDAESCRSWLQVPEDDGEEAAPKDDDSAPMDESEN